ncbi:uncharacterized protein LOC142415711 [Mycteria americana]|uniref:uncharacterized protein LOC142415711 n=1 Tax=Mycteria americana TaxID=33587 RepID=UPI003F586E10
MPTVSAGRSQARGSSDQRQGPEGLREPVPMASDTNLTHAPCGRQRREPHLASRTDWWGSTGLLKGCLKHASEFSCAAKAVATVHRTPKQNRRFQPRPRISPDKAGRGQGLPLCARESSPDEGGGNGYPASWLDVGLEPVGHPGDPLKVDGFPTSWPLPVLEPESNPTAVPVGEGAPASRLGSRTEPPGDGMVTDVPAGRTFAAPRLDAAPQPGWRRRGPPRAKYQAEGGKKSPEPSEVPRQMLEQLERGHVRSKPGEESHGHVYEFIQTDSGASLQLQEPSWKAACGPRARTAGPAAPAPLRAGPNASSRRSCLKNRRARCPHGPRAPRAHPRKPCGGGASPTPSSLSPKRNGHRAPRVHRRKPCSSGAGPAPSSLSPNQNGPRAP